MHWEEISPDLSLNDVSRQGHSGGEITRESAGAEVHATCACVVENPHRKGEIWASTDDGLVHVTRDDGVSWTNVTPPGMPALAYVGCVEISGHDPATIYVAATRYKLSDYAPYLFRSTDSGASWVSVNGDFPAGEITRVVRADSVRAGLLFVGTESGVFFSLDDGAAWHRLPGGLPVVPVYDLKLKGADLVAGTHGRSFWVLDDITPLREFAGGGTALVTPRPAIRTKLHFGALGNLRSGTSFGLAFGIGGGITTIEQPDGTKKLHHLDVGENPPNGAIVYYRLGEDAGPVRLVFHDEAGAEIITFASDDARLGVARRPTTKPGLNRFVWDLRHPGPDKIDASLVTRKNKPLAPESDGQAGPTTVPGAYSVTLLVGGADFTAAFSVVKDKRVPASAEDYARQFALLSELNQSLSLLSNSVNRIRRLKIQLAALGDRTIGNVEIGGAITAVTERLSDIEGVFVDVHRQSPRDALRNPAGLGDTLVDLINTVSISDTAPTAQAEAVSRGLMRILADEVTRLDGLVTGDVAGINATAALVPVPQVVL